LEVFISDFEIWQQYWTTPSDIIYHAITSFWTGYGEEWVEIAVIHLKGLIV